MTRPAYQVLVHLDYLARWVFEVPGTVPATRVHRRSDVEPTARRLIHAATGHDPDRIELSIEIRDPSTY